MRPTKISPSLPCVSEVFDQVVVTRGLGILENPVS